MARQTITGRDAFLQLLQDEGVTHLFGNPGTTELAIMEAVPKFPGLKYVLGLQESIVLGMADGFARASGKLTACNLHCAPGLGHAMGALYNAKFSGSPIIVTAGQYEIGYGLTEPLLYEPLVPIAQPLVKWAVEVQRAEDLPRIVHRAAKIAMTPPMGPVFISLPGSILDEEAEFDLKTPSRIDQRVRPGDDLLDELVDRMLSAKRPVILAGRELSDRDALAEATLLAEQLGAAVYLEPVPYNVRFPAEHPNNLGDITRNQKVVRQTLESYDLLICLGSDLLRMSPYSPVEPLPDDLPVVHISERQWEIGKNYATEMGVCADVKTTLQALLPVLENRKPDGYQDQAAARNAQIQSDNWTVKRQRKVAELSQRATQTPIDQNYLMYLISESLPADAIVVEEALTSAPAMASLLKANERRSYYGLASGGLGFGVPGAVGVSLAQPDRQVVAVLGDGSAMYSIQALWTAAHFRLPITFVLVNNRSYRVIKERLQALRGTDQFVAMDMSDPPIDFVHVATGLGVDAISITDPSQIREALQSSLAQRGPRLIEVIVDDGYTKA